MLKVKKIDVFYGPLQIIREVSFEVKEGEVVCLLGANGSGKSTVLKAICGLSHVRRGEVWYMGRRIDQLPSHIIASLGLILVPDTGGVFPSLRVLENLEVGSYLPSARKERDKNLERVFSLFPILRERKSQLAGSLSGGEQRMLGIARGLMASPKMLLLDEPSSGLGPIVVKGIFDVLSTLKQEGLTLLLSEQAVTHALRLAQRGHVLESGRIILEDDSSSLLSDEHIKKAYLGL